MKEYRFVVEQIETYSEVIVIQAESQELAVRKLRINLEEEDLSVRKNTYDGMETKILLNKAIIDLDA